MFAFVGGIMIKIPPLETYSFKTDNKSVVIISSSFKIITC